jgi:hypothetical protein
VDRDGRNRKNSGGDGNWGRVLGHGSEGGWTSSRGAQPSSSSGLTWVSAGLMGREGEGKSGPRLKIFDQSGIFS